MSTIDFSSFALSPATREVLTTVGYTHPTPVQVQAIPPALEGNDVIACAATGTGKTAAFVLPMVERLKGSGSGIFGLVLAPTRELAAQLHTHAKTFGGAHHLSTTLIIGGANQDAQVTALKRANIVIATPGRLVDHLKQGTVSLD
ncbi:MAG: DEAD/DEAH box helicase, partial [Archangium sp.]|nr:DEAD/DEAH box helicase [Archangium sp.]